MAIKYGIREQGYNVVDPEYNSRSIWDEATEGGDVPQGQGLPQGGEAGQVLTKDSSADYDASWKTPSGGGGGVPAGGTTGQIIIKNSDEDYDASWKNAPYVDTTTYNAKIAGIEHDIENLTELIHDGFTTEQDVRDIVEAYNYVDTSELTSALSSYLTTTAAANIYATKTQLQTVENSIPSKTSELTNDSGYITATALDAYVTASEFNAEVGNLTSGIDDANSAILGLGTRISNVEDSKITDPETKEEGQVLTFNGSAWVAATPSGGGGSGDYLEKVNPTGSGVLTLESGNDGSGGIKAFGYSYSQNQTIETAIKNSQNLVFIGRYGSVSGTPSNVFRGVVIGHSISTYQSTSNGDVVCIGYNNYTGAIESGNHNVSLGGGITGYSRSNCIGIGQALTFGTNSYNTMIGRNNTANSSYNTVIGNYVTLQGSGRRTVIAGSVSNKAIDANHSLYIEYGQHVLKGDTSGNLYKDDITNADNQYLTKAEVQALIDAALGA